MNLRALSLAAAIAALISSTANGQAQQLSTPPYSDAQAAAAAQAAGFVTQPQLAAQSASDISTAAAAVPAASINAGVGYGFLTSTQTQSLLAAIAQSFIPGYTPLSPGTTASLLSSTPASAANVGKYAVVSDLFGSTNEVLRSGYTAGFGYYWRPQRTDYAESIKSTGGAVTLVPLTDAPYVFLSPGTLASSMTVNLSGQNAWPGATFTLSNNLTLGLFNVTVAGTGLNTQMAQGASKTFVYDGSVWRTF